MTFQRRCLRRPTYAVRSMRCCRPIVLLLAFAAATDAAEPVRFSEQVRPLLSRHCVACHGGVKKAGGVSFLDRDHVMSPAESGEVPVQPGNPGGSEMIVRVTSSDAAARMPPPEHGPPLKPEEVELLREWIRQGAPWELHWAFRPPVDPPLPAVNDQDWPSRPLDVFILASLEKAGLSPSAAADRRSWLRRVSFDLTGLPPTREEIATFVADESADAYETIVDRLLQSPQYGERWAAVWMELSRCSDTMGYERDPHRTVWPWRDWVVKAFNDDLPYDEFLTKQLAGDLLPNSTIDDRLATVFHRNTQTNTECGSDDEEFRVIALLDRMNTTWEGLMSSSFRCAQCHDHPYDPLSQVDFYRTFALFNTTQDHDANEDFPQLAVPVRPADRERAQRLDDERVRLRTGLHEEAFELNHHTSWSRLKASSALSTGASVMAIGEVDGIAEVTAGGNIPLGPVFTLDFPLTISKLTAVKVEALPFEFDTAATASENGFVVSQLQAQIVIGEEVRDVLLSAAFDEDPTAFFPVEASFQDDLPGWSGYPRFNRPRAAIFAPSEPVDVPEGAKLRLILTQKAQGSGIKSQALQRSRYSATDASEWTRLVQGQAETRQRIVILQKERDAIESVRVPVLREQHSSQRRNTKLFVRGNFLDRGETVTAGVPSVFGDIPVTNRLEFARWMTRTEHPLTSRAAVNRIWLHLFGSGLAEVIEDFGTAGRPPTHPELLNHLAVRFSTTLGWSQKRLLRELVLSSTYRQSAAMNEKAAKLDADNRLLSRGPRTRLTAEMIRDHALAASGLLSLKQGGPPVMPIQPAGIWRTVYNGSLWETSPGEDAHRRSIYTFNRRTSGYPSYLTFDASSREVCVVRRIPSNTPLQALVTLNDPVYIEAAKSLARRMAAQEQTLDRQIAIGFELTTSHPLPEESLPVLRSLHATAREQFLADPDSKELSMSADEAALTAVANALLNLDAAITK